MAYISGNTFSLAQKVCSEVTCILWSKTLHVCVLSHFCHVRLFATRWTVARKAPMSMGFSRQEYWSGLPCPPPGDLPDPGIELTSAASPALTAGFFTTSTTWEAQVSLYSHLKDLAFVLSLGEKIYLSRFLKTFWNSSVLTQDSVLVVYVIFPACFSH